jgi:uncharacterized protein with GYD domain
MTFGKYSTSGAAGVFKDGYAKRRQALEALVTGMGGQMGEMLAVAEEEWDFVATYSLPDDGSAAVMQATRGLMVGATGGFDRALTYTIMDVDAVDAARSKMPGYQAPNQ